MTRATTRCRVVHRPRTSRTMIRSSNCRRLRCAAMLIPNPRQLSSPIPHYPSFPPTRGYDLFIRAQSGLCHLEDGRPAFLSNHSLTSRTRILCDGGASSRYPSLELHSPLCFRFHHHHHAFPAPIYFLRPSQSASSYNNLAPSLFTRLTYFIA